MKIGLFKHAFNHALDVRSTQKVEKLVNTRFYGIGLDLEHI